MAASQDALQNIFATVLSEPLFSLGVTVFLLKFLLAQFHNLVNALTEPLGASACFLLELPHHQLDLPAVGGLVLLQIPTLLLQLISQPLVYEREKVVLLREFVAPVVQ